MPKNNLGRKRYTWLTCPGYSLPLGDISAGAHAGAEAGPWKKAASWLVLHSLFNLLSCASQDHLTRGGAAGTGPRTPIINQENIHTALPIGNLKEAIPPVRFLFA